MRKIAIDGRSIVQQRTGVGEYAFRIVKSLLQIDPENEYWLFLTEPIPELEAPNLRKIYLRPGANRAGLNRWWENVTLPAWLLRNQVDVFFGPNYVLPAVPRAKQFLPGKLQPGIVQLAERVRLVAMIHDLIAFRFPQFFTPKMRYWQYVHVTNAVRVAHALIVNSSHTRRDLVELFPGAEGKVFPVPLALDERFRPICHPGEHRRVRQKYALPERYVLYVGTIEPRKNVSGLLRAYAKLPSELQQRFPLILVGSKGWLYEETEQLLHELPFATPPRWLGYVASEDLPTIYSMAEVFVFPSFYEGFGFPPLEALACGVPVIASQTSSLPEVVGDAGLLVDPGSVDALARALRQILTDPALRQALREKALPQASKFRWQVTAEKTLQVLLGRLSP